MFVDELISLSEHDAEGFYTFKKDEYFYQGHFKNNPIIPGVILTEVMAQIGVVSEIMGFKFPLATLCTSVLIEPPFNSFSKFSINVALFSE